MNLPAIIFGFLLATLFGAAFHLWRGGGAGKLLLYLILGWVGFLVGQIAASLLGLTFDRLGDLHLGSATVGSFVFLGVGHWLSLMEIERKA
jgi:uncharacterized membrane protein YeaQ/YmgE (transglycosylase-associated protein family)